MNSLELTRRLYQEGTITKEAALDLLRVREKLIKQALAAEARQLWANLTSLMKEAGWLGRGAAAAAKSGLFDKLRRGGLTPGADAAKWSDVGANLLKMLGIAGLSASATAGAGALFRHRRDRALQTDIESSYQQMFDEYKELKALPPDQLERVRTHFGVLARFAPSLAADPTVAGSFVKDTATMGIIQPKTIQTLAETQRRIDEMHEGRSPFGDHFDRGLSLAGKAMAPGARARQD
jgi:hypothetical protein